MRTERAFSLARAGKKPLWASPDCGPKMQQNCFHTLECQKLAKKIAPKSKKLNLRLAQ